MPCKSEINSWKTKAGRQFVVLVRLHHLCFYFLGVITRIQNHFLHLSTFGLLPSEIAQSRAPFWTPSIGDSTVTCTTFNYKSDGKRRNAVLGKQRSASNPYIRTPNARDTFVCLTPTPAFPNQPKNRLIR